MNYIDLTNYEEVKNMLSVRLVNQKEEDLIKECPSKPYLDLAKLAILFLSMPSSEQKGQVATVDYNLLKAWGISEEQLFADAESNMPFVAKPTINTLEGVLNEEMGMDVPHDEIGELSTGLYVLSNQMKWFGSAAIIDTQLQAAIHEAFGGEAYYVIPCSVHEVIMAPTDGIEPEGLRGIIREVNATVHDEHEYLSDTLYICEPGQEMKIVNDDVA